MAKNFITLTVEFDYNSEMTDFNSVVASLVHKIGNIESDEMDYRVQHVYRTSHIDVWDDDDEEDWE
jgi:hypothetical protein